MLTEIKIIHLVSQLAFGFLSINNEWLQPICDSLGIIADGFEKKETLEMQYQSAMRRAIEKTRDSFSGHSYKAILNELLDRKYEIESTNINEIIKETEGYRIYYSTDKDAKRIISVFDFHFQRIVGEYDILSRYQLLAMNASNTDMLNQVLSLIQHEDEVLMRVERIATENNTILKTFKSVVTSILDVVSLSIISLSFFLIISLFFGEAGKIRVVDAAISLFAAEGLCYYLNRRGYIVDVFSLGRHKQSFRLLCLSFWSRALIGVAVFVMISVAISYPCQMQVISLFVSCCISSLIAPFAKTKL